MKDKAKECFRWLEFVEQVLKIARVGAKVTLRRAED